jgi:hypothetical protein
MSGCRGLAMAALGAATVLAIGGWQLQRLWTEKPRYDVERRFGPLEIRRYAPRVVAETEVETADFEVALREGFRRLARYIFGDNERAQTVETGSPVEAAPTLDDDADREDLAEAEPHPARRVDRDDLAGHLFARGGHHHRGVRHAAPPHDRLAGGSA